MLPRVGNRGWLKTYWELFPLFLWAVYNDKINNNNNDSSQQKQLVIALTLLSVGRWMTCCFRNIRALSNHFCLLVNGFPPLPLGLDFRSFEYCVLNVVVLVFNSSEWLKAVPGGMLQLSRRQETEKDQASFIRVSIQGLVRHMYAVASSLSTSIKSWPPDGECVKTFSPQSYHRTGYEVCVSPLLLQMRNVFGHSSLL